jgi:putative MFS transporter
VDDRAASQPPGWFRHLFFFLRMPEDLTRHQWRLLGLLGVTVLINHYDFGLLTAALLQIQTELGVPETEVGRMVGMIRAGAILALPLAVIADRRGRRRMLVATILGFTLCTILTAFAQTATQFTIFQFFARMFVNAEELLAIVVIAEELPAKRRGFALGVLAALGSLGNGVAFIGFGFIEVLPYGWRSLYIVGAAPLLLLAWIRRTLPETRRFESERGHRLQHRREAGFAAALQPVRDLVQLYPGRVAALAATIMPASMILIAASTFPVKFLQEVHGWTPGMIPVLMVGGGVLVFASMALSGTIADRVGRRRLLAGALLLNAAGIGIFYNGSGWAVVPGWILMMAGLVSADVMFGALGSELFPTSYRSTASGLRAFLWMAGGSVGLVVVESQLFPVAGSHAAAVTLMLAGAWIAPLAVLRFIPETARRELEQIAPGREIQSKSR